MHRAIALAAVVLILSACGTDVTAPSNAPPLATVGPATPGPSSPPSAADALIGTWVRTQSCEAALAAFEKARLFDQIRLWVVANWVAEGETRDIGEECDGARPPEEHSHFFTADGQFGSLDADGNQVDSGDYVLVGANMLAFPSHSQEFAYDGEILVDFTVVGDTATFKVVKPLSSCENECRISWGWALSAFFRPGSWSRSG